MDRPLAVGGAGRRLRRAAFYYVLHIVLIHVLAIALVRGRAPASAALVRSLSAAKHPGLSLPAVYAWWVAVVLTLYPRPPLVRGRSGGASRLGERPVKYIGPVLLLAAACAHA
jgi:hypothetical protein